MGQGETIIIPADSGGRSRRTGDTRDIAEESLPVTAGAPPLTDLSRQATFREQVKLAREKQQELDRKLLFSSDPLERADLEHELAESHSTLLTAEVLDREFRKQHAALVLGTHPQEGAIRIFCEARQVEFETLITDEDLMVEMFFHLEELQVVVKEKQRRDEQVLPALVAFLEGEHPDQKLLETLNSIRKADVRELKGEELIREFGRLDDKRRKLLVDEGLGESERRKEEAFLKEQELQQLRDRLEEMERVAEEKEQRLQHLEERLLGKERRRREILERVQEIRQEERRRTGLGDLVLYDTTYGYLMAEAWRQLDRSLEDGKFEIAVRNDHFFFVELKEMLEAVDFEERYFHEKGKAAIEAVNAYRHGDLLYAELTAVQGVRIEWLSSEEARDESEEGQRAEER